MAGRVPAIFAPTVEARMARAARRYTGRRRSCSNLPPARWPSRPAATIPI